MVTTLLTAGVFLGTVVLAAAIVMFTWLILVWWENRKRDRAFRASQAQMVQSLDEEDAKEPPMQHSKKIRKYFTVFVDDPSLFDRFEHAHLTIYLEGGTIMLADVDVKEVQRRMAAWEQEMRDTEELSNIKPLATVEEAIELSEMVNDAEPFKRFREGNKNMGSSSPKQGRTH